MAVHPLHPCLHCGACCAHFRVAFHWTEADDVTPNGVPVEMTVDISQHRRAMKGTQGSPENSRCVALSGEIPGALCSIYDCRSSTCRDFPASWEDGAHNDSCDRARIRYGLPLLQPEDFLFLKELKEKEVTLRGDPEGVA